MDGGRDGEEEEWKKGGREEGKGKRERQRQIDRKRDSEYLGDEIISIMNWTLDPEPYLLLISDTRLSSITSSSPDITGKMS